MSWNREDNDMIRRAVASGKSFDEIAARLLPGRTAKEIKDQYFKKAHPNIVERPFSQSDLELLLYYYFKGVMVKNMAGLIYSEYEKGYSEQRIKEMLIKLKRIIGGARNFEEARIRLRQSAGLPIDTEPTDVIERASSSSQPPPRSSSSSRQPSSSSSQQPRQPSSSSSSQPPPTSSYLTEGPIAHRSIPPHLALATLATMAPQPTSTETFTASEQAHPPQSEARTILDAVAMHGTDDWDLIASFVPGRTARYVRDQYEQNLRGNVVHRPFTQEDDELLVYYYYKGIGYTNMYGLVATDTTPGWSTARLRGRWRSHLQPIVNGCATFDEARTRLRQSRNMPVDVPSTAAARAQAAYAAEPVVKQAAAKRMGDESAGPPTKRRLRTKEVQIVKLIMMGHTKEEIADVMGIPEEEVDQISPYVYGTVEDSLERLRHI
jgi:hypothetical protein